MNSSIIRIVGNAYFYIQKCCVRYAISGRIFFAIRDRLIPIRRRKIERLLEDLGSLHGKACIDAGANVGNVTAVLYAKGAKVYAYEPDRNVYPILCNRFENKRDRVCCIKKGLWGCDGVITLYPHSECEVDPAQFGVSSSFYSDKVNIDRSKGEEVEVVDVSRVIEEIDQPIALVKLDIEGAEFVVLNRMIETGAIDKVERVYVETHESVIPSLRDELMQYRKELKESPKLSEKLRLNWL